MSNKRFIILFFVLAFVAAAAALGWIAGSRIESPADAAARTAAPKPSPILVPVEERVLSSNIVTRGTARFGLPQPISIAPSALKLNAGLITTLPLRNDQFEEGDVMLTVSGRPVFILQGQVPGYRDLVPGNNGNDVLQLEQGLKRLGFDPGPIDGLYDVQTSNAVSEWYKSSGWEAMGPTQDQLTQIRTLERDLAEATKIKLAATRSAAATALAVESARANAKHNTRLAAAELTAKTTDQSRQIASGEIDTSLAVTSVRAKAEHDNKLAAGELAAIEADKSRRIPKGGTSLLVESERAKAQYAIRAAEAEVAAQIAARALVVLDPRQPASARAEAEAKLKLARAAAEKTRLENEMAVQTAERDTSLVQGQLELARAAVERTKLESKLAIQAAERDARLAAEQLELARTALKTSKLAGELEIQTALDAQAVAKLDARLATDQVNRLTADLEIARNKLGIQIPIDEIVFNPTLPVRVEEVTAKVGDTGVGPIMSVTDNQLSIDSSLPLDAAPLVKSGMQVNIDEQALGINAKGIVNNIANTPGTHGVDGYHIYFEVLVEDTSAPLKGFSLRLTIPIESTEGIVTAVPISALSLSADGTSRIQVETDGKLEYMVVEPGLSADGYVEVTPVDGVLTQGKLVVVGYENPEDKVIQ